MILLRRPIPIYDVDLIGTVMIGIVGVIAYVTVIQPAQAGSQLGRQLAGAVQATEAAISRSSDRLDRYLVEVQALSKKVKSREQNAPTKQDAANFPQQISAAADAHRVLIQQILPNSPRATEQGTVCDVQVVARGGTIQLIQMLDALRRNCPHMQVQEYGISQSHEAADPRNTLTLTLRLFVSPEPSGGSK